jgi:citrate synthase
VAGLAAQFHDGLDIYNEDHRTESALQLIAKMPTLAAMTYRKITGQPFVAPNPELDYAENFLNMCFGEPGQTSKISSTMASAMDKIFILHADHEQNASTSTVRLAGSTEANPYAAIAAGIAALWGPSHGGANEAVLTMLEQIGDISEVAKYVDKAKDKDDSFKLMGFGHRVYKNFDPRALVMQDSCHAVLAEKNIEDEPLLKIATRLEKIAREEPYFIERRLYPNIDFYSGITLKAMAIPTSMYTVVFALGRTPGWISHWCEMLSEPFKIGRPRQLYLGSQQRNYTEISSR